MIRKLIILAIILLIPMAGFSQTEDPHSKWYLTAKYWNQENFPGPGHGGIEFGGMLDIGPHIYGRLSYGQINFFDSGDVKVLGAGALWFPPLSDNWAMVVGGTILNNIGIGNPYSGTDVMWSAGIKFTAQKWYPKNTFIPGMLEFSLIFSQTDVELLESWVMAELMVSVSLPITK